MTATRAYICLALLLSSLMITAQESNISPYSYFGVGDIQLGESGRTAGMASASISISGRQFLNTANPATLASLDSNSFVFDVTGSARWSLYSNGSDKGSAFSANFSRLTAGLHVTPLWSSAISLQPYSIVSYKVIDESYIEGTDAKVATTYEGKGGITSFSFLNSLRLTQKFSLGADLMMLFGEIDRDTRQSDYTFRQNSITRAFSFKVGMLYREKLSDRLQFSTGLTYMNGTKLTFSNALKVLDASENTLFDNDIASSSITIPSVLGAGISFTTPRLMIAADYSHMNWSGAYNPGTSVDFTNTHKLSLGAALLPSAVAASSYFDIMEYQAGVSISNSYLVFKGINPLNIEFTAGAGMPFRGGGQINLTLAWGKRGTINEGLIREDYVRFVLSLSMAERMFLRRMYE